MSERSDQDFLSDIHAAIGRVRTYIADMSYESFAEDTKTQDAVIRNLEILGEAAKRLSEHFRADHPDIPWKNMAAARDRLIHGYFGVNLDIVWQIAFNELPVIDTQLKSLLEGDEQGEGDR